MCESDQVPQIELSDWIKTNQPRITKAVLDAFLKIDEISEAMTDDEAAGEEKVRQKIQNITTGVRAVLAEHVGEAFENEFSELTETLVSKLKATTMQIIREQPATYIDLLIQRERRTRRT